MTAFSAVGYVVAVTYLICALLTPGSTNGIFDNPQSSDITLETCGGNQFRCRNGDCIQSELLCDGRADCSDQSDETQAECAKPELTCPTYAFRCTYGACVNGDAACNGIKDCVDNSDEAPSKCPTSFVATRQGGCGPTEYRCQDGQCIDSTSLCDGTVDCSDGSDETYENCKSFDCGSLVFRCNYGACINGDLTCNNVTNCADGSDEGDFLCRRPLPVSNPSGCMVPPQPKNGYWRLNSSLCEAGGEVNCGSPQGHALDPGSLLMYGCNDGFKIKGNPEVYCVRGGRTWSSNPVCIPITCSVMDPVSTRATCFNTFNEQTNCLSPVPPGTRAEVECLYGYRKDSNSITQSRIVICNQNGKWKPEPIKCVPDCGKAITHVRPTSVGGTIANVGDFPWHATIYEQTDTREGPPKKEFKCGATIIQDNLVMTAAHCIYDENTHTMKDPNKIFIMTGNVFRDFDSPLNKNSFVRKESVKNVHWLCRYAGFSGNYASDIALLELKKPLVLSNSILPACLDLDGSHPYLLIEGSHGKVAGFGATATGQSSGILQTLTLPYVPDKKCNHPDQRATTANYFSVDKFCAGYNNGSAVCPGDSGGGLVFKGSEQWYVLGIVSLSLGYNSSAENQPCERYSYSLYTRVSSYRGWIRQKLSDLKRNDYSSSASCDDGFDPSL